ncbi:MAG: restriction endonuclease [Clostridiales bacterium]|nr:restriction endonuclease [Clostridiales bacterium]
MIPKFDDFYPYILKILENKEVYKLKDIREILAKNMSISESARKELLPSKKQTTFDNRVNWACIYLTKAGILDRPTRGEYKISPEGETFIREKGYNIKLDDLKKNESFRKFLGLDKEPTSVVDMPDEEEIPEEQIDNAFKKMNKQLSEDLLNEIFKMSPKFFEILVLDLLRKMGYGGKTDDISRDSAIHTGDGPDDGIDGLIKEDELGLDYIYVQAKRWTDSVGKPEIQKFAGALSGKGAKKGVFLTTSGFSKKAIEFANYHQISRIVLIDGEKLTNLMIDYGVGLSTEHIYKIQNIDKDYFDEDKY